MNVQRVHGAAAGAAEMALVGLGADDTRVNTGAQFADTDAFVSWVNVQPIVTAAGQPTLFGSMQPEFR